MTKSTLIKLILLTALVLFPRLWPFPPGFLTVDEIFTARWLTQMAGGVFTQNWAATTNDTYPAVSLMWLEVVQVPLLHLTTGQSYDQLLSDDEATIFASIPRRRFVLGLINGLILLAAFALIRRLFNETTALIATLLMALDPFMLTQSQVVRTEGLNFGLMLLSALSIMTYASTRHRHWLIISALLGGLATLTRFISIYLWPFAILTMLLHSLVDGRQQPLDKKQSTSSTVYGLPPTSYLLPSTSHLLPSTFYWATIATLTFIILWPALWVTPLQTLASLYDHLARTAQGVDIVWHEGVFFYQGQLWHSNPGIGFYGWALAYRTPPFIWLGLALLLIHLLQRRFRLEPLFAIRLIAVTAYITFYLIAMSLGESKLDRYLLPTFPAFAILAAIGYESFFSYLTKPHRFLKPVRFELALALLLTTHLAFTAYYFPYYFTYWNPLLGGATAAVKILPVGTGEGVDKMVSYLNTLPNAKDIKVASNHQTCRFAFVGTCLSADNFLASDYFITIVAGIQRQQPLADILHLIPDAELVNQYRHDGLDYAWLYRLPQGLYPVSEWLGEHGRLLGFRVQPSPLTQGGQRGVNLTQGAMEVGAGNALNLTLFWQNGAHGWQLDDSEFFVNLLDEQQQSQLILPLQLQPTSIPYLNKAEHILVFTTPLTLPATLSLGRYTFELGLRLRSTHETTWQFDLTNIPYTIMVTHRVITTTAKPQYHLTNLSFEQQLDLLGYDLQAQIQNNRQGRLIITLYWHNRNPLTFRQVQFELLDAQQQSIITAQHPLPISPTGHTFVTQHFIDLTAPPAQLIIKTRPIGQTDWDALYQANQPQNTPLTIDQLLSKIAPN